MQLENTNIVSNTILPTPHEVKNELPLSRVAEESVYQGRQQIEKIIKKEDKRLLVVVGPCAIYDLKAALEYAARLAALSAQVKNQLLVVMRVYFEKPRTTTGWKGLINDPFLDDSFRIDQGLRIARKLMSELAELGLPLATEALDPLVPQYISDLVSWTAIGARTTESQTHREMSSGLSMPVGFKNGTDGNVQVAVNAVKAAAVAHRFLGINQHGQSSVFHTRGNKLGHVVLRGGNTPNYDRASVAACKDLHQAAGITPAIMIDCSHGNSLKDYTRQSLVFNDVLDQVCAGDDSIIGWMVESNLEAGRQELNTDQALMRYGVSITDACINWKTTESLLIEAANKLAALR